MRIRLATLNTGLLSLLGGRFEPSPHVQERSEMLPGVLLELNAQVIVLQEIYRDEHRQHLIELLRPSLPYSAYPREKPWLGLENGLMAFSAMPLEWRFERFCAAPIDERIFDRKGFLICRIRQDDGRQWSLVNIHTTAGGTLHHPESAAADHIRQRQITQMLRSAEAERDTCVIVGDLNAGPGVSEGNFRQIEASGYQSVHDLLNGRESGATWDPNNPLNCHGPHRHCPKQRIDHVFVRASDLEAQRVVPLSSAICCQHAVVPTSHGLVTASDHYGLCIDFDLNLPKAIPVT